MKTESRKWGRRIFALTLLNIFLVLIFAGMSVYSECRVVGHGTVLQRNILYITGVDRSYNTDAIKLELGSTYRCRTIYSLGDTIPTDYIYHKIDSSLLYWLIIAWNVIWMTSFIGAGLREAAETAKDDYREILLSQKCRTALN